MAAVRSKYIVSTCTVVELGGGARIASQSASTTFLARSTCTCTCTRTWSTRVHVYTLQVREQEVRVLQLVTEIDNLNALINGIEKEMLKLKQRCICIHVHMNMHIYT